MGLNAVKITLMSGAEDGKVFELDKTPIMIGRHPGDDIYLPYDTRVSRHHARLTGEGYSIFIEDVGHEGKGSNNGTYLGEAGAKVIGKTVIHSGQLILLGAVWIKYELGSTKSG